MIRSMTAYARKEINTLWGQAAFEIRSVNHRYLEISTRLPEQFRTLEIILRDKLKQVLTRGKVECNLRFEPDKSLFNELSLNENLVKQILSASDWLKKKHKMGEITPIDILRWPGVISAKEQNLDQISVDLIALFDVCLAEFIRVREREGDALNNLIKKRLDSVKSEVNKIYIEMPAILVWQKEKLTAKLAETGIDLENNCFEQELILTAQRIDITEELDRLLTHVNETQRILQKEDVVGRRLDFMMQEFNREANTIASKSINVSVTNSAIELKVLIEQIREQIQNIE